MSGIGAPSEIEASKSSGWPRILRLPVEVSHSQGQFLKQGFGLGDYVREDESLEIKCSPSQLSNIDPFLAHAMYMSDLDVDLGFEIACRKFGVEMEIN